MTGCLRPNSTIAFLVKPTVNYAAVYYPSETLTMGLVTKYLSIVVAVLLLVECIVTLLKTPYISVELAVVGQLAFFGLSIVKQLHPAIAGVLGLTYSNGYNIPFANSTEPLPSTISALSYRIPLICNFNISLLVLSVPFLVASTYRLYAFKLNDNRNKQIAIRAKCSKALQ